MKFRKMLVLFSILFIISSISVIQSSYNPQKNKVINQNNKYNHENSITLIQSSSIFSDFSYYKNITIDHTKVNGTGTHENFPVLINILDSDLHNKTQANGDDIAFGFNNT